MGGGNKKGGGAPQAPDFSKAAMVNQSNPFGGVNWNKDAQGNLSMNTSFSPAMQGIFGDLTSGMQAGANFDPTTAADKAQNRVMDFQESRLNPIWDQRQQNFNASMANQGLQPGEAAYGNAANVFGNQMNDAYSQAMAQAVGLGQGEQAQARANAQLPFGLAAGMNSMLPKGNAGAPFAAAQAQYNAAKDSQEAQNSKKGSALGGLGSIAGTIFGGPLGGMAGGALGGMLGGGGDKPVSYNSMSPMLGPWEW